MGEEAAGAPAPFAAPATGTVAVYRGATLIDGAGGPARPSMTVVVDGAQIRVVAPDDEVPAALYEGARVIDVAGQFVIPGLIDSHQHIATPPDRPAAEATLRRLVYGGVTAIRIMADDLRQVGDLSRAALVGEIPGPDIGYAALMAGPGFFDDPRTWQVSQGETPGLVPWMQAITDETDLPLAVAMAKGTNATAIKIYADLPGSLVAAITAEAHRQGLSVWAHGAVFPASPSEVVGAGVDSISHVTMLAYETAGEPLTSYKTKPPVDAGSVAADDPRLESLFSQLRARGTIIDATGSMWLRDGAAADAEGEATARASADLAARLTGQAYRAGVQVSAGTDYETDPDQPHPALHAEMAFLMQRCGIPAEQVIRSATLIGARSLGAEATMGTIEPGKLANFVVLARDPLADMANLSSIALVVKRGHRYDRSEYQPRAGSPAGPAGGRDAGDPKGQAGR